MEPCPARAAEEHLGLYDANVSGWLTQQPGRQLLVPLHPRVEVDHVTVYRWVQRFTPLFPTPPALFGTPGPVVRR